MSEIPEVPITAVEFLSKTADIIETIKSNIEQNRLGRKAICTLLKDYSTRAVSDGRLMNAARQETHCANRGLFLAYSHMEFIWMLVKKNYTIPSTAVKWYSWKQFLSKNRLPAFWSSAPAFDLRDELNNIERNAALLYAEVQLYNIEIPTTTIVYPRVPVAEPSAPPAEGYNELIHRGIIAQRKLEGISDTR